MATKKKRGGHFQASPWTQTEVDELFNKNKAFRAVAMRAVRNIYRAKAEVERTAMTEPTRENARELAHGMVGYSRAVAAQLAGLSEGELRSIEKGEAKKKIAVRYPHPALLLAWVADTKPQRDPAFPSAMVFAPGAVGGSLGEDAFEGAMASAIRSYSMPGTNSNAWARFASWIRTTGSGAGSPHFVRHQVYAHPSPGSGNLLGFRLASITIRVPFGNKVTKVEGGESVVGPSSFATREIDLLKMNESLGEVWIGVGSNGRSLFLASTKGRPDLKKMIAPATVGSTTGMPGGIATLHPRGRVRSKLNEGLRKRISQLVPSGTSRSVASTDKRV